MMEVMFKNWLLKRGNKGAANSYPKAIHIISEHYSKKIGAPTDIFKITDQRSISELAHHYSQAGKFSEFGYEQHGRFRAAMGRYSDFFVQSRGAEESEEDDDPDENEKTIDEFTNNFAYEKDLQTALCSQITEVFPSYKIYGGLSIGVEYSIGGRRIDVLLEHDNCYVPRYTSHIVPTYFR